VPSQRIRPVFPRFREIAGSVIGDGLGQLDRARRTRRDAREQEKTAERDADDGDTRDEPRGPFRVRGGTHLVGVPVVLLLDEEVVKMGACGLIGDRQLGGERGGIPGD
jgi:hypothetical protein